jgi:hypothetical protein
MDVIGPSFIRALCDAEVRTHPFRYLLLEDCLPESTVDAIAGLPFEIPQGLDFAGRREVNNSKRIYFNPPMRDLYPVCEDVAASFDSLVVREALGRMAKCDLSGSLLRIEYCQDTDGFWLEPHTDIAVKRLTLLIYLSRDPELADAGTDLYEGAPDFKHVGTAPYAPNAGLIFVPASDTWHGVERRKIHGVRKSIIVNYVTQDWRERWELCAR